MVIADCLFDRQVIIAPPTSPNSEIHRCDPRTLREIWLQRWFTKLGLPSGKRLHSYGNSPSLMVNPTINGPFSIAMLNYQRVHTGLSPYQGRKASWWLSMGTIYFPMNSLPICAWIANPFLTISRHSHGKSLFVIGNQLSLPNRQFSIISFLRLPEACVFNWSLFFVCVCNS